MALAGHLSLQNHGPLRSRLVTIEREVHIIMFHVFEVICPKARIQLSLIKDQGTCYKMISYRLFFTLTFFSFGRATWHVGSYFPDQELNPSSLH